MYIISWCSFIDDTSHAQQPWKWQEYNPFAGVAEAVFNAKCGCSCFCVEFSRKWCLHSKQPLQQDDAEDEGAFDSLIEMLRAAEREGHSPSRPY